MNNQAESIQYTLPNNTPNNIKSIYKKKKKIVLVILILFIFLFVLIYLLFRTKTPNSKQESISDQNEYIDIIPPPRISPRGPTFSPFSP